MLLETSTPFGEKVKEARKAKGMTQTDLAKAANMSIVTVCHLERGVNKPNARNVFALAKALDISFDELWLLSIK